MSFPAQNQMIEQKPAEEAPVCVNHTYIVKSKYEAVKAKGFPKINLNRIYTPSNQDAFILLKEELKQLLQKNSQEEKFQFDKYLPMLLGYIEGTSDKTDYMLILQAEFGGNIHKVQDILAEKFKVNNYAWDKKHHMCVREVSDKKLMESMGSLFNIKEMKAHRKNCGIIKSYCKSLKKFIETFQKESNQSMITENSDVYDSYMEFYKDEKAFTKLNFKLQSEETLEQKMADENEEKKQSEHIPENLTPLKTTDANKKTDTASTHKNADLQKHQKEQKQKIEKLKGNRVRRTKEQIQKAEEERKKQKQQKAKEKQMKKEQQRLAKLQEKEKERLQKQRLKEQQKMMKEQQKLAKQTAAKLEKEAKQREKQKQRLAKQAEKLEKERKNNPGQSLFNFFKPKTQQSTPKKSEPIEEVKQLNQNDTFFDMIDKKIMSIQQCRAEILQQKMIDENSKFEPYYVNIVTHKSRLQFKNYFVSQKRFSEYIQPHQEMQMGKYDDSSVEYQDLCGDVCEQIDAISVQQQESFNSAIVPDSYISGDEVSSVEESKDRVIVHIDQGDEWSFIGCENETADKFTMVCLFEDQMIPLAMSQPEQSNQVSVNLKCQLYKQIHGFYGVKDPLIKKLATIASGVPKSYLDNLIKETTTKRGNQRLVKPQIIDFLNQQKEGFSKQLQQIRLKRNSENIHEVREKVSERQKQIERLILEEAGTFYIIDLLQFLREKGYRMTKRELTNFTESRPGDIWEGIRKKMQKMQLKTKNITQFLTKEEKQKKKKQDKQSKDKDDKNQSEYAPEDNEMKAE